MTKEVLSARLDEITSEQLDEFADRNSLSRSEAAERLIHQSLRIEKGDVEIVPVSPDGGIDQQLDQTRQALQSQSNRLEEQEEAQLWIQVILFLVIVWLTIINTFSVPIIAAIVTGLVSFGGLAYTLYRYWGK
jgi:hypothetical protein